MKKEIKTRKISSLIILVLIAVSSYFTFYGFIEPGIKATFPGFYEGIEWKNFSSLAYIALVFALGLTFVTFLIRLFKPLRPRWQDGLFSTMSQHSTIAPIISAGFMTIIVYDMGYLNLQFILFFWTLVVMVWFASASLFIGVVAEFYPRGEDNDEELEEEIDY